MAALKPPQLRNELSNVIAVRCMRQATSWFHALSGLLLLSLLSNFV
jgi:hypothetical protein